MSIKKELILKILDELDSNDKVPTMEELELEKQEYGSLLEIMERDGLIYGNRFTNGGGRILTIDTDNTKITIRGIEYLQHNNPDKQNDISERIAQALEEIAGEIKDINIRDSMKITK